MYHNSYHFIWKMNHQFIFCQQWFGNHGEEECVKYLACLSNIYAEIQFTMEREGRQLSFLDAPVMKRCDWRLGHRVFLKPIHVDHCLHWDSNHHLGLKWEVVSTLIDCALWIC